MLSKLLHSLILGHIALNPDESGKMVKIRVPHKETPVISKI